MCPARAPLLPLLSSREIGRLCDEAFWIGFVAGCGITGAVVLVAVALTVWWLR